MCDNEEGDRAPHRTLPQDSCMTKAPDGTDVSSWQKQHAVPWFGLGITVRHTSSPLRPESEKVATDSVRSSER